MSPIDWKVPPPIHDDNSSIPADNWKVLPSVHDDILRETDWKARPSHDDNPTKKNPTDWKVPPSFDDDNRNSTKKTLNDQWKVPSSSNDDNPFQTDDPLDKDDPFDGEESDWNVRSSFHDDKKISPADWKDTLSFRDDNLTKTTPPDNWKGPLSFHDGSATKVTPTDTWNSPSIHDKRSTTTPTDNCNFPPLIADDSSPKPTSNDNPKIPPLLHDNNSLPNTIPTHTPYLQLSHLLSLAWLAYPVISLVFVAFRLQLSLASAENGLITAQNDILSSCNAAQQAATGAASFPRYLALASNQQFADAANGSMEAARDALILSLDVLESTINFIIDFYRSTFLCFIGLVVQGGLSLVLDSVQAVCNPLLSLSFLC